MRPPGACWIDVWSENVEGSHRLQFIRTDAHGEQAAAA
jgi:hypothetical protein